MKSLPLWLLLALLAAGTRAQDGFEAPLPFIGGDAERGRLVFASCRSCHYTNPRQGHGNGPNLYRIFGKVAGQQPGFDYYSPQLQAAGFVWTPQLLYGWLENPMAAMPDTTMMSNGVPDPGRRADLVAYLQQISVLEVAQ
jgi:cytochrome c